MSAHIEPISDQQPNGPMPVTGKWTHDLCGCCDNCCPGGLSFLLCIPYVNGIMMVTILPCLVGQIAGRASWRPNFFGAHGPPKSNNSDCKQAWCMFFLITIFPCILYLFEVVVTEIPPIAFLAMSWYFQTSSNLVGLAFLIFFIVFTSNLRYWIRNRYRLPPSCCCDCCVMFCCFPCAIAQMYKQVYAQKKDCGICSDPGPHVEEDLHTKTTEIVTTTVVTQQPQVVMATAQPVVAAAYPAQPVVAAAQPVVVAAQPVVVVTQTL